jgi:hypothetical protein
MRLFFTALIAAIGVGALVGGIAAFVYGLGHPGPTSVVGLGRLDGIWTAENYCFLGGALGAGGSALATFGFLLRPVPGRREGYEGPVRR